ncbi:GntP family permease [Ruminococcaceae bacterium OttesenSCG-928-L11]|nr:GntP family permease [Ruminococcaceae bacterium OttesenSCG-928-L11]
MEFVANPVQLIIATLLGFGVLLFLIIRLKVHALLAILVSAVVIGIGSGMPLGLITQAVGDGMGNTLKSIALIVGLGSMFGGILEVSGAAECIADKLVGAVGEKRAGLALGIAGVIIGIPVFYDPAFIILMPLVYSIASKTKKSMLYYVLPMTAGLGIGGAIPPTPAPMLIAGNLQISLGAVTLIAVIYAVPKFIISYLVAQPFGKRIPAPVPESAVLQREAKSHPGFGMVLFVTLIPLLLILLNAVASMVKTDNASMQMVLDICIFVGQPYFALLVANLAGLVLLGVRQGINMESLEKVLNKSLQPVAMIVLVTAGGGVLRYVLDYSGMGKLLGDSLQSAHMPVILIAFVLATLLRVCVGSTTVALTMTLGIIASFPQMAEYSALYIACIGMAALTGATSFSQVNDSGFWLTKEYLGIDLKTAYKTWTLYTGVTATLSFAALWALSLLFA